jgi:hypothetical protein
VTVPAPIEPSVQFGGGSDEDVLALRKADQRWFPRPLKALMDLVFGAAVVQSGTPTDTHVWTYDAAAGGCKFKASAGGGTTSLSGDVTGTTGASVVSLVGGTAAATVAAQLPASGEKSALAGTSGTPGSGNKYVTDGDSRMTNSRAPSGAASGDLSGTFPGPSVATVGGTAAATIAANLPATGEKAALAGTSGTPGSGNKYVTDGDSRNTNARTPTTHATSHLIGGSDAISTLPTSGQKDALAGTTGTPSSTNKYVTDSDTRLAGTGSGSPVAAKIFMAINFR